MSFFKGHTRILYVKDGEDYKPIGCLTSNPFTEGAEMLPTTTAESGGWKTSLPTNQFFSITFEGIQVLSGEGYDDTLLSYDSLKDKKRAKELIEWRISNNDGSLTDEGKGYITEIGESNSVGEFLTFSGSIEGFGQPVFSRGAAEIFQNGDAMVFQNGDSVVF